MLRPAHPMRQKGRTGLSLIEAAIVMGIAGIVLGAIWSAGSMVYTNMQISRTIGDLAVSVQNIRTFYKGQSAFTKAAGTNLTETLVAAELFPAGMIDEDKDLPVTPWGTDIRVYVGGDKDTFRVSYESELPEAICRNLVGRVAGKNRPAGLVNVTAAGSSYSGNDVLNNLTPTSMTGSCKSASFTFKLKG